MAAPNAATLQKVAGGTRARHWPESGRSGSTGVSVRLMRASGGSMCPLLRDGDWLFVDPSPVVRRGDVAILDRNGEVVVHRVLSVRRGLERGDAGGNASRFRPEQVVGRVVAFNRAGHTTDLGTPAARMRAWFTVAQGYRQLAKGRATRALGMLRPVVRSDRT